MNNVRGSVLLLRRGRSLLHHLPLDLVHVHKSIILGLLQSKITSLPLERSSIVNLLRWTRADKLEGNDVVVLLKRVVRDRIFLEVVKAQVVQLKVCSALVAIVQLEGLYSEVIDDIFNLKIRGIVFDLVDYIELIDILRHLLCLVLLVSQPLPLLLDLPLLLPLGLLEHLLHLLDGVLLLELHLPLLVLELLLLLLDDLELLLGKLLLLLEHLHELLLLLLEELLLLVADRIVPEYRLQLRLRLFLSRLPRFLLGHLPRRFLLLQALGLLLSPLLLQSPLLLEPLQGFLVLQTPRFVLFLLQLAHDLLAVQVLIELPLAVVQVHGHFLVLLHVCRELGQLRLVLRFFEVQKIGKVDIWARQLRVLRNDLGRLGALDETRGFRKVPKGLGDLNHGPRIASSPFGGDLVVVRIEFLSRGHNGRR